MLNFYRGLSPSLLLDYRNDRNARITSERTTDFVRRLLW